MATDAYALDLTQDYLVWDNRETITVYPAPRRENLSFPVENAKRRNLTTKELAASQGAYTSLDRVWLLPVLESQALHDAYPLSPWFVIEDAQGSPWTVLEAGLNTWETWWRCVTRNLIVAANLQDLITIERPEITEGESGEPVYAWPPQAGAYVVENFAAKVQITDAEPTMVNGVETAARSYDVILSAQIDIRKDDRVVWLNSDRQGDNPRGMVLQWQRLWNPERIDELPRLACMRV